MSRSLVSFLSSKQKGFTLIESLVFLMLFSLISIVFLEVYTTGTRMIIESKNRLGATALANQKMEIIRSIEYEDIGTKHWNGSSWVYGIPAGELLEDETVSVNTVKYEVHTFAQYVDDAFDSTVSGSDTVPTDYKRVRITVSWGQEGADQTVALFGNFSPNGSETSGGGGVLSINVLDASGSGVSGTTVRITNPAQSIDVTGTTDSTGNITFPGAPAGVESYVLAFSKGNYYGSVTYPSYPTSPYNPVDVHASVVAGALNQKTLIMDQEVQIPIRTKDPFGNDVPDIDFTLEGGRVLGTDPVDGERIYGFSASDSTDSSGEATFADQSYGQYTFTESHPDYQLLKLLPESTTTPNMFDHSPGDSSDITAVLLNENIGSVKMVVTNSADDTPVQGATVQLSNAGLAYDATLTTDQYGFVYFPTSLPALLDGTYDIEVTASGFTTYTGSVNVNGSLEIKNISLNP